MLEEVGLIREQLGGKSLAASAQTGVPGTPPCSDHMSQIGKPHDPILQVKGMM